jgi:hypothetical protein
MGACMWPSRPQMPGPSMGLPHVAISTAANTGYRRNAEDCHLICHLRCGIPTQSGHSNRCLLATRGGFPCCDPNSVRV